MYRTYLTGRALKKEVLLAQKSDELQELNARLEESQHEVEQQKVALIDLNAELNAYVDKISEKNLALDVSNKTKDKLFNIISHDLKSPLSSLVGLSKILKERIEKADLEQLDRISDAMNSSTNRLQKLVLDLLDWSRTQTGSITPNIKKIQLKEIIDSIYQLYAQNLKEKNLRLEIECSPNLYINADYNMFETVVRNIVNNAIKFSYSGGVIRINVFESTDEIILRIRDNGVGMSKEQIDNLIKHHETNSTFGTNNEAGTGLGLLVCYEFLLLHNFLLQIDSKEGEGSTFIIQIPFKS